MLPVLGPAYRALRQWLAGLLPTRRQGDPSLPALYLIAVLALAAGDIATRLGWGMAAGLLAVPVMALALHRASLAAFLLAAGLLGGIATAPQPPAVPAGSAQPFDPARS